MGVARPPAATSDRRAPAGWGVSQQTVGLGRLAKPTKGNRLMRLSRLVPRIDLRRAPSSLAVQILALFVFATLVPLAVGFIQTSDDVREAQDRALDNAWQVADAASSEIEGDHLSSPSRPIRRSAGCPRSGTAATRTAIRS